MRMLHVVNGLGRGGAETNLLRLIVAMRSHGIVSDVLDLRSGAALSWEFRNQGIRIKRPWESRRGYALTHGWLYVGCVAASALTRGTPVVWQLRHVLTPGVQESAATRSALLLMKHALRADALITNSEAALASHAPITSRAKYRAVIPNGIDVARFELYPELRAATRDRLGLARNEALLLQVARYHPHKGHRLLLKALPKVLRKYRDLNVLLLGDGVTSLPAMDRVVCLEGVNDPRPYYAAADALVNPSLTESCPTVVLEAMASGIPCIVTDVGDSAQIVGKCGWVSSVDASDLAEKIDACFALDRAERRALGESARARVRKRYTTEELIRQHVELYRQLVRSGDPVGSDRFSRQSAKNLHR